MGIPHLLGNGLDLFGDFLHPVFLSVPEQTMDHMLVYEWITLIASVVVAAGGILYARKVYIGNAVVPGFGETQTGLHRWLLNKYYIDELYDRVIVRPIEQLAWIFWKIVDVVLIDGLLTIGALIVQGIGSLGRYTQTGVVQHYALIMVIGAVIVIGYLVM
ncbi:MAG: hypothetical protein FJY97_21285 [candidate division Zixibacteria bacterium]|nr:hypothetical protein [candidate division Zixibacteria bacterium]